MADNQFYLFIEQIADTHSKNKKKTNTESLLSQALQQYKHKFLVCIVHVHEMWLLFFFVSFHLTNKTHLLSFCFAFTTCN